MMKNNSSSSNSEESGNNNGDNDEEIEEMMQHFMVSWLSENNLEDDASKQDMGVSICIKEEDDYPHPRHLCFKHPFATTSYDRYYKKCYCYVCEEVAPCKKWDRPPNKHSQATPLKSWISSEKKKKAINNNNTTTMARHTLLVSFVQYPPDQIVLIDGGAGGLITDGAGNWVAGFSVHINSHLGRLDSSVSLYMALIEALQLAWTRGFRFLDIGLGYLYHEGFWEDFKKDGSTGKYRLRQDVPAMMSRPRAWGILREVEGLINRDWFVSVKNSVSIKEDSGAFALAMVAGWVPMMQVYDFPSHPLTSLIKRMAESTKKNIGPLFEANFSHLPGDPFKDLGDYYRLN